MRKSAAPSVVRQKRPQFAVPYARNVGESKAIKKIGDISSRFETSHKPSTDFNNGDMNLLLDTEIEDVSNNINCPLKDAASQFPSTDRQNFSLYPISLKSETAREDRTKVETALTSNEILALNNLGEKSKTAPQVPHFYNVVWCKRSMKKHKKWEGDAILIIKGCTAILKDTVGKELAKGLGYKIKEVTNLTEGSRFFIGGKECEILSVASEKDCAGVDCFAESDAPQKVVPAFSSISKKYHSPIINRLPKTQVAPAMQNQLRNPDATYMPQPSFTHQWDCNKRQLPLTDVKLDSILLKHLRPHQREGVIFMYECVMGFRDLSYQGVILGDEMGLGKTLQCITLIWTLYKQGPYGGIPIVKKVLIITPSSLVKNWQAEFFKWLGRERIPVFAVSQNRKVADFINSNHAVLIISYEMYVRSADILSDTPFDLVICDEGHRLKNMNIKTSNVILSLPTMRRILLTGTPIQNDLGEFYSIVEFVNPGILGSAASFRRVFEDPITRSRHPDCTEDERIHGEDQAAELATLTGTFLLRRTQEVINKYLPPKIELVIFCRPSTMQCLCYGHMLGSRDVCSFLSMEGFSTGHSPLAYIIALRKLCNHPTLLRTSESENDSALSGSVQECTQQAFPTDYTYNPHDSGKMEVVEKLLISLFSLRTREKIVLVSNFVQTLDLLEDLCKSRQYRYLRLDGSTNTSSRLDLVDQFNSQHSDKQVFLLSAKAGGVGLNLIGASRILLYDIDWNPATDLQAMARVWRDGQRKVVYIYRLLTTGTIEEKMYQRQISKQELYSTITESSSSRKAQFSLEELKDLFQFHKGVKCQTHDIIQCECLKSSPDNEQTEEDEKENIENPYQIKWIDEPAQEKHTTMDELLKWKHLPGIAAVKELSNSCLERCDELITFLFMNTVNFGSTK